MLKAGWLVVAGELTTMAENTESAAGQLSHSLAV